MENVEGKINWYDVRKRVLTTLKLFVIMWLVFLTPVHMLYVQPYLKTVSWSNLSVAKIQRVYEKAYTDYTKAYEKDFKGKPWIVPAAVHAVAGAMMYATTIIQIFFVIFTLNVIQYSFWQWAFLLINIFLLYLCFWQLPRTIWDFVIIYDGHPIALTIAVILGILLVSYWILIFVFVWKMLKGLMR